MNHTILIIVGVACAMITAAGMLRHKQHLLKTQTSIKYNQTQLPLTMASYYFNSQRFEETLGYCDKAIELNPQDSDAWSLKGLSLEKLSKYEDALKCFDKATEIKPNSIRNWLYKGLILKQHLKKYKAALECYDKAIALKPAEAFLYPYRAMTRAFLLDYDGAIADWEQAIKLGGPSYEKVFRRNIDYYKKAKEEK